MQLEPPSISLPPAWPYYREETLLRVADRIRLGDVYAFGGDPAIEQIEAWARDYFGVEHALAVSSGTAALQSAYHGLALGPGDHVLAPSYTFHATVTPLIGLEVDLELYDCVPDSPLADLADIERRITSATKAVVVSHMFGLMSDMEAVRDVCRRRSVPLVEDAAQAHGAERGGGKAGTFGIAGCFSLGGQKMISGGMGGLLITDDRDIYERALVLGHSHERALSLVDPRSDHRAGAEIGAGMNLRMHPLAAELAWEHCTSLDERIAVRTRVLEGLTAELREFDFIVVPETPTNTTRGGWYGYKAVYQAAQLGGVSIEAFVRAVQQEGLKVDRPTTKPLHLTELIRSRRAADVPDDTPNATALYARMLSFPDKHLHNPADEVVAFYADGIRRAARSLLQEVGTP